MSVRGEDEEDGKEVEGSSEEPEATGGTDNQTEHSKQTYTRRKLPITDICDTRQAKGRLWVTHRFRSPIY